jgi:hypothetical protein
MFAPALVALRTHCRMHFGVGGLPAACYNAQLFLKAKTFPRITREKKSPWRLNVRFPSSSPMPLRKM